MSAIGDDIKSGVFHPLYLLYGEETYLLRDNKRRLKEAVLGGDTMNFHYFEGKDADIHAIIDAAETLPFFAEHRLIVVENSGLFKKSAQELVQYLPGMPDTSILLFVEPQIDKRNRLYKAVADSGVVVECARQDEEYLKRWILSILRREGRQITRYAMSAFLENTGNDMERIRTELDKLLSYTEGRTTITPEDVKAVGSVQVSGHIFDLVSAISSKNRRKALSLYNDLLQLRESPMRILFLVAKQFNQLLQARHLADEGKGPDEIASVLGLNRYVAGRMRNQARSFRAQDLEDCVTACVEAETAVKTGRLSEQLAVEMLLVRLSS